MAAPLLTGLAALLLAGLVDLLAGFAAVLAAAALVVAALLGLASVAAIDNTDLRMSSLMLTSGSAATGEMRRAQRWEGANSKGLGGSVDAGGYCVYW